MASSLFDVRRGEGARVVRAGGAMFAILAGFTIAETARDSLFLGSNGAGKLAVAYLLLAVVALVALAGNVWLVRRLGRRAALVVTLLAAAAGTALFYPADRSAPVALGLYLWTGLIGTVVVVQFWLLAGTRFTTAEAKRLYGPIAAAGAIGTLVGASLAWGLLHAVRIEVLLLVAAGFFVIAAGLLARDDDNVQSRLRAAQVKRRPGVPVEAKLRGQGYAGRLAILTVCATAAALLADYLLKSAAAAAYGTDDLARFIARYNGCVAALSLVFQVVGSAWLVRKIGVLGMILLLPTLMLFGSTATFVTAGSFVAAGFTKGADASLRYSVTRVATELLWMPVPENVRTKIREPLESVVTRLVQAVTAGVLLVLVTLQVARTTVVAAILIGITFAWTYTAARLRKRYLAQLRSSFRRTTLDLPHELDQEALATVVDALSSDDDRRVIAAIQILVARGRARSIPALILRHDSIAVLTAALAALAVPGRADWIPLTRRLQRQPDPRARTLALRALARVGDETATFNGLCDEDAGVNAHGVFWSLQSAPRAPVHDSPAITQVLAEPGERGVTARRALLDAICRDGDSRWAEVLLVLAFSGAEDTFEALARAIGHIPDPRFIPFLIQRLGARGGRVSVRAALVAIGEPAMRALEAALVDPALSPRVRLHVPGSIAAFNNAAAANALAASLASAQPGAVRYRILRALARIATREEVIVDAALLFAELRAHLREHTRLLALSVPLDADASPRESAVLLRGLLHDKIAQALDRAFLALQVLHPREDIRDTARALAGHDLRSRAHASEFLDILTRMPLYASPDALGIREQLLAIAEDLEARERLDRGELAALIPDNVEAALVRLMREPDALLAACAGYDALHTPSLRVAVDEVVTERPLFAPLGIAVASRRVA